MIVKKFSRTVVLLFGAAVTMQLAAGCAALQQPVHPRPGQRLTLNYTCRLADGTVAATTVETIGDDPGQQKAVIFHPPREYQPAEIVVPDRPEQVTVEYFGSFDEKIVQTLTKEAQHLSVGRPVTLELTGAVPDNIPPNERYLKMAINSKRLRRMTVSLDMFRQHYPEQPQPGLAIEQNDKFKTVVERVNDGMVTLLFSAVPGATLESPYGTEHYIQEEDNFTVHLNVREGAVIRTGPLVGRISEVNNDTFTIDYGHPFGGETLSCEVEARPADPDGGNKATLSWLTNYEQGVAQARREHKPMILMLYADWCKWCHRMFDEVLPDERLVALRGDFVWVRINSDQNKEYMERFGQKGFPMLVVLSTEGKELKKFRGFQDAASLSRELGSFITNPGQS